MRSRPTGRPAAALLLLLHAVFLTAGGASASPSAPAYGYGLSPRAAGVHAGAPLGSSARAGTRATDARICTPTQVTRPAQGEPPRVQVNAGGPGTAGGTAVLPAAASPRSGARATRAGPHHGGPFAQRPPRTATARAPPATAY